MAKKAGAIKLPKKIAGIRISKRTRKSVGHVIRLLGSPAVKTLLGSAIAALAGALAGSREASHSGHGGRRSR